MCNPNVPELSLLENLRDCFRQKSLYFLGAGASAGYILPNYNLVDKAKQLISTTISASGIYTIDQSKNTTLTNEEKARFKITGISDIIIHETFGGKFLINDTNIDVRDEIIHANPWIVEAVCALEYSLDQYPNNCPEYQIFNYANPSSLIANMNHDGLANHFIKKIDVISLHGIIDPPIKKVLKNVLNKYLSNMLFHNTKLDFHRELCIATAENEHILAKNESYIKFISLLKENDYFYIVFVGYSFFRKNDYSVYDEFTFEITREFLNRKQAHVIIIDPNPNFIEDILASRIHINRILSFPVYWDKFTHAFYMANNSTNIQPWVIRFISFYNAHRLVL